MQFLKILNFIPRKSLFIPKILFWRWLCFGFLEAKRRLKPKKFTQNKSTLKFRSADGRFKAYPEGIVKGIYFSNYNILYKASF